MDGRERAGRADRGRLRDVARGFPQTSGPLREGFAKNRRSARRTRPRAATPWWRTKRARGVGGWVSRRRRS